MLVPRPTRIDAGAAPFTLTPDSRMYAPEVPEAASLLRELLCPVTGFAFPDTNLHSRAEIRLLLDLTAGNPDSEAYHLVVDDSGITATAVGLAGLRWAVQSLRQLLPPEICDRQPRPDVTWTVRAVTIVDMPRYPWRGLMVDVGRWYKPVEWLYRIVDLLALHRMNVLHLHLTEDQGWRFEVRRYPKLTEVGGFRAQSPLRHGADRVGDGTPHGGFYTQQELRDLVAFASRRGVTVIPEIDLPGHTQAAIAAYPELGNNPGQQLEVWTGFGISTHVLNVADETVEFFQNVLDELLEVFPSRYIHLGGDEVSAQEWTASTEARARMEQLGLTRPELLGWWIGRLSEHLEARGRRVVLWDELVGQGAPKEAVIMAWRGEERVEAALAAGHDVVATPHTSMYLNYPASRAPGEPLSIADGPSADGFGPLPLSRVYGYDPEPAGTTSTTSARVIGAQGNLWSEYAPTPARAEYDLMPRLARGRRGRLGWPAGSGRSGAAARRPAAKNGRRGHRLPPARLTQARAFPRSGVLGPGREPAEHRPGCPQPAALVQPGRVGVPATTPITRSPRIRQS